MILNGSPLGSATRGAIGGLVGTGTMTLAMGAAQKLGFMGRMPPAKIVDAALQATPLDQEELSTGRKLLTGLAHVGFGVATGALFGLVYRSTRKLPLPTLAQGALFATAVWAVSYKGWIPALDIMPPPEKDRPGRPTSMLISHWIYGAVLAAIVAKRSR